MEEKEGKKFDRLKYCTQVVAGINYFIKVLTENVPINSILWSSNVY